MEAGRFRQDLFYRLGGVTIAVPVLRERVDDIPLLADHFLRAPNATASLRRFRRRARWTSCAPIPGPATCGSSKTRSAASS
jgi:DNA-binding NtrC family response regulator